MITCTFENGKQAQLRHITVGAIAVNEKNQVLLTKRAPHLLRGNYFTIPGGFLDRDETVQEAVLRELQEETGLTGEIQFLLQVNDSPKRPKEDRQNVDFIYVVTVQEAPFKSNDEVIEAGWYDESNIPKDEEFAFDHRGSILLYYKYCQEKFPLSKIS